jgi:hypothetical protein
MVLGTVRRPDWTFLAHKHLSFEDRLRIRRIRNIPETGLRRSGGPVFVVLGLQPCRIGITIFCRTLSYKIAGVPVVVHLSLWRFVPPSVW